MSALRIVSVVGLLLLGCICQAQDTEAPTPPPDKDVCIVGAGAAGMYAAVQLRDRHYSVVVLEKSNRIGGHAVTYRQEGTPGFYDLGVKLFPITKEVQETFERFKQPLESFSIMTQSRVYMDLKTGNESDYPLPWTITSAKALWWYSYYIDNYYTFLKKPGMQLPDPVPEELLLPLGEFMERYGLQLGLSPFVVYLQGLGDADKIPTLYAMKKLSYEMINAIWFDSFVAPANGMDKLYEAMEKELGSNVILKNTDLQSVKRLSDSEPTTIQFKHEGESKHVDCGQVMIDMPPTESNLAPFHLPDSIGSHFAKFKAHSYWTTVVMIEGLPNDQGLQNVDTENPLNAIRLPGVYAILPMPFDNLYNVLFGSNEPMPEDEVKAQIKADIERLRKWTGQDVVVKQFVEFYDLTPFGLHVDSQQIKEQFYSMINSFQGKQSTWYIGAALSTNNIADVWFHTDVLIEKHFKPKEPDLMKGWKRHSEQKSEL